MTGSALMLRLHHQETERVRAQLTRAIKSAVRA